MTSKQHSYAQEVAQPPDAQGQGTPGPTRWLVAGGLGIVLLAGGFWAWRFLGSRQGAVAGGMPPVATVKVAPVQVGAVQNSSEFIGSLEAETGVVLQPEVSGRVTQIFVTEGDRVSPGIPVMRISPDRTQAEVSAAQASVSGAQANINAARAARDSAEATLRSLKAREEELKAELALSSEDYERSLTLAGQGAISRQDLDVASRDLDVSKSLLASAREEIAAAEATLAQSEASLDQATATLSQAEANRAVAQENLQDRTVKAPINGTVGEVEVKLGTYVTPSTVITNIMENAVLELDLEVPIEERDRLRLGLPVQLLAPGSDQVVADGTLSFISPQANAGTQTVLVKAQFENAQGRLQDSQRVEARLVWSQDQGVLVPTSAVTRLGGQSFVYVAVEGAPEELPSPESLPPDMPPPEQVARLRPVELGDIQDNQYQVLSGLEPGETIVVSGILNLQDGTPILPQE